MKWTAQNISEFLLIYQKYYMLWNVKHKDYTNSSLRSKYFHLLINELDENNLLGDMDEGQLRKKIKSIRDNYRQEMRKVEKSLSSGCSPEDVYTPKLAWYKDGDYLSDVMFTKTGEPSMVRSQKKDESESEESNRDCQESDDSSNDNNYNPRKRIRVKSPEHIRTPVVPIKQTIKQEVANIQTPSKASFTTQQFDKNVQIVQGASEDKPYDQFGKFVAYELRQLPPRQAILLQQEIQNSIIRSKLSSLDPLESAVNVSSLQNRPDEPFLTSHVSTSKTEF